MQLSKLSTNVITKSCTMACLMALTLPAALNAQVRDGRGGHRGPHNPPQTQPTTAKVEVATINSYMDKRDKIDVIKALKLKDDLKKGKKLVSLSVKASSNQYDTKMVLKLNGSKVDAVKLGVYASETGLQVPMYLSPQDELTLSPTGDAFVQEIKAVVEKEQQPLPPQQDGVLKAQLNMSVYGQETIALKQVIKDQNNVRLQGLKVDKVILKASSASYYQPAQAQLIINGTPVGYAKTLSTMEEKVVFDLPNYAMNVIGEDIQTIKLKITGNAFVKMVGLKEGKDQYKPAIQVNVNQTFHGSQRISLSQLVKYAPGANTNAPIESLTIVARGSGNIMITNGASMVGSMSVQGYFGSTETIAMPGHTSIDDVKMRISGSITIESVRIKLK